MEEITEEMLNPRWRKAVRDHMNKANALYQPEANPFFPCPIVADDRLIMVLHAEIRKGIGKPHPALGADEKDVTGPNTFLGHLDPALRAVILFGIPISERSFAESSAALNKFLSRGAVFYLLTKLAHIFYKLGVLFLQGYQFLFNKRYQVAHKKGLIRQAVWR